MMMEDDVENAWGKLGNMSIDDSNDKRPLQEVQNIRSPIEARSPKMNGIRSGSESDQNQDEQFRFNKLVIKAKRLAAEGDVGKALELNKKALKIHYTEKLAKRIKKMEAYLAEYGSGDDDDSMEHVGNGFYLYRALYNKLFAHQKEGILWFWELSRRKKGGILGDDMGLGKTIQVIAFLSGMFDMGKVQSVLIVLPVSLIGNWEKEFTKWAPGICVKAYHGSSKKDKERALAKIQYRGGVMLTSYGLVVTSWQQISQKDGAEFTWDYVILDEGHKIKNPTKTTKGVHAISAKNRIILTGTPIQNNLKELWALFDFVHHGQLLGTARTFKMEYDTPITRSRERDATMGERHLGQEMAESLKRIIEPFFLRRTKAEVTDKTIKVDSLEGQAQTDKMPSLGRKNDLVLWLFLTQTQLKIYDDFLNLESVKELLMTSKSPLVALTVLKKICDHPRLLSTRACAQLGLDGEDALNDSDDSPSGMECAANKINHIEDSVLIGESGKLVVLVDLLDNLKSEGHRCLIFSQSRKMLNIIEKILSNRGHKIMRLDGTVTKIEARDQRIQKFQTDTSYSVFLLTTQVGGVGLTLTAADRVIIFDPSWNPATDAQAVDRVFRIGQNKNVVIYRLITCGSVEEKIYRRQIFKDSITRQTTGNSKNPYRYFTKGELKELFTLDDPRHSKTQRQLQDMHGVDRRSDPTLDAHIAFLHALEIFGVSDHDLMFSQEHANDLDSDQEQDVRTGHVQHSSDYIQSRVQKAQELLQMESSLSSTLQERFSKYPRTCDVEPRQTLFQQPKTQDRKPKAKVTSPFESDVPLPAEVDLTRSSDLDDEPEEIEDSPEKVMVKVERSTEDNDVIEIMDTPVIKEEQSHPRVKVERSDAGDVIEIEDTPAIKKEVGVKVERLPSGSEVKISPSARKKLLHDEYDADESMTEDADVVEIRQNPSEIEDIDKSMDDIIDGINQSMNLEPSLEEEVRDVINQSGLNNNGMNQSGLNNNGMNQSGLNNNSMNQSALNDNSMNQSALNDNSMNQSGLNDDGMNQSGLNGNGMNQSRMNLSHMNATCERIEDYLADSDQEDAIEELDEPSEKSNGLNDDQLSKTEKENIHPLNSEGERMKTPEKKRPLIIHQEIMISPEPSSPLIEMKAKRQRLSMTASPAQFLSRTLMSCASDTPDLDSRSSTSSTRSEKQTIVDDSPVKSKHLVHIADSRDNTPALQTDVAKSDVSQELVVFDSDEETPVKKNRRRSVCKKRVVIESSDEESGGSPDSRKELHSEAEEVELHSEEDEEELHSEAEEDNGVDESLMSEEEEKKAGPADNLEEEDDDGEDVEEEGENSDDRDFIDDSEEEDDESESDEDSEASTDEEGEEEEEGGLSDLSPNTREQFEMFVQQGRSLYLSGEYAEALANILQAIEIYSDPQLQALALKLHQDMQANS